MQKNPDALLASGTDRTLPNEVKPAGAGLGFPWGFYTMNESRVIGKKAATLRRSTACRSLRTPSLRQRRSGTDEADLQDRD
jgi:hypothetical protein